MKNLLFTLIIIFSFGLSDVNGQGKFEIQNTHPRVVLSKEAELLLKFLFLENKDAEKIKSSLKIHADKLIKEDFSIVNDKGILNIQSIDDLFLNITTLGMAFRLYEEKAYADKIVEYISAIAQLPEWPMEYSTTLITASAIGYDWLYYDLNQNVRESVRNSIVRKGLYPGLETLKNKGQENNWISLNPHYELAYSSALVLGSLAVADDFPDVNKKIIYQFLINNQGKLESLNFNSFRQQFPDSWQKEVSYLSMGMASIHYSLGHDFNVSNLPSIKSFATEYVECLSNNNRDDAGFDILDPSFLWFAKLNGENGINDVYISNVKTNHLEKEGSDLNFICLIWMI